MNSLVSTEIVVVIKSTLVLYVFVALDVLDVVALLGVVVVGSVWILEVGVTVTITVEKVVVTVIVKLEQKDLLRKGDEAGDELIKFDVVNDGEDKEHRDERDEREGEGDFEEKNDDNGIVVEGERYGGDWEGDGEGEGDRQLLSGSIKCNEVINSIYQIIPCILITTGRLYWNTVLTIVKHKTINGSVIVWSILIHDFVPVLQSNSSVEVDSDDTRVPFLSKALQCEVNAAHPQVALNISPGDIYMIMSVVDHDVFVPCLNILPVKV